MTAQAASGAAAPVFSLFRAILRLHRQRLPPPLRVMGNTYAKDEFARHLQGNTTTEQWATFMEEWRRYCAMLGGTADLQHAGAGSTTAEVSAGSGELSEALLQQMSPDQRRRLQRLQHEAVALGGGLQGKDPAAGQPPGGGSS